MASKAQKKTAARKTAEAAKAKKKVLRDTKSKQPTTKNGTKGKSIVPQSKAPKKK